MITIVTPNALVTGEPPIELYPGLPFVRIVVSSAANHHNILSHVPVDLDAPRNGLIAVREGYEVGIKI